MAISSSHLMLLFLLYSFTPSISSSPTNTTTIPITVFNQIPHSDPFQRLTRLASTSKARAHHLKNPQNAPTSTTPLSPFSGAYSITLSFGTPSQSIPLIMDTGSSFTWFPCTKRYVCKNCSVSRIPSYIPKQSSSSRILGCTNPKCRWVHTSLDPSSSCQDCQSIKTNCKQACPPYIILYGSGSTGGVPMVETLNMPHEEIRNFLVGCSLFSSNQPAGVVGFGRGMSSLPSQLKLKKFSYCLVSHKFDNTPKSSLLVMDTDSVSDKKSHNFSYTPLLENPTRPDYYYVGLRKITVGGEKVKTLHESLTPDTDGNGGTIVDSGSTFTYMNKAVFRAVANAFVEQVRGYKRTQDVEGLTGLRPCFDVSGRVGLKMPELKFHFKGGAKVSPPLENYFLAVDGDRKRVVCLAIVTDDTGFGPEMNSGPGVILGNFLMQGFGVEFDLGNERFGFRQQQHCS